MICIQRIVHGILRYGALHFTPSTDVPARVTQDLAACGISINDIKHNKIIIDFRSEGQCEVVARPLIDYLKSIPAKDILVIFSAVVDTALLDYRAVSIPNRSVIHEHWLERLLLIKYNDTVDRKFLCLMRRASRSRATITKLLLDSGCDVRISFGSMTSTGHGEYRDILPGVQLPLLLDNIIDRVTNDIEHDQTKPMFHSCLFNLVAESSSQTDPETWKSKFISEKTFKAFGLRQIPVWFAVPGLVTEIRKLGFDMFDDIVDHSYDSILDERERFQTIAQQVQALDQKFSLEQCQQLRKILVSRLNQNFDLLTTQAEQVTALYNNTIKDYRVN